MQCIGFCPLCSSGITLCLILHVVWLQSSAAPSKVSGIRPRSPPSGDIDACSASKIGLKNKHEHDLPNITWYCTL